MSLRLQASADARAILEDQSGFGWPMSVKNPQGVTAQVVGFSTDIGQMIDPGTGQAVSGNRASVAVHQAALIAAGLGLPVNIHDESFDPWTFTFADSSGVTRTFKVVDTMPDNHVGTVVCMLESYSEP